MRTKKTYKVSAEILLGFPIALLLMLGVGELVGGMQSGAQHFFQLFPLLITAIGSWIFPRIGGRILMMLSFVLALGYLFTMPGFPFITKLMTMLFLFGIPFLAGSLFFLAEKKRKFIGSRRMSR